MKLVQSQLFRGLKRYSQCTIPRYDLILDEKMRSKLDDDDDPLQSIVVWGVGMDVAEMMDEAKVGIDFLKGCVEGVMAGDSKWDNIQTKEEGDVVEKEEDQQAIVARCLIQQL